MRDRRGLGVGVPDGDGDLEGIRIGGSGFADDVVWPGAGGSVGRALAAGAGAVDGGVGDVVVGRFCRGCCCCCCS